MKADLAQREPKMLAAWEEPTACTRKLRAIARGRPRFVLHDGPPYANGALHLGHCGEQDAQGHRGEVALARRLRLALRPGLGLPRPADRAPGREEARPRRRTSSTPRSSAPPAASSRRSRSTCSAATSSASACWATGIDPYLTMDPRFEAPADPRARQDHPQRTPLQGREARALVPRLPLGAGRSRGRIRGQDLARDRRRVPRRRHTADLARRIGVAPMTLGIAPVSLVIWTTTPWTLPANEAVALGAKIEYVLVGSRASVTTAASRSCSPTSCSRPASRATASAKGHVLAQFTGERSSICSCEHPFLPKQVPVIVGDHVTLEAGTGAVHTAPAHGQDDFVSRPEVQPAGRQPRDGRRPLPRRHAVRRRAEGGRSQQGAHRRARESRGRLLKHEPIKHSYPHCWRHKTPVIFRATPQWFISMDQKGLRANALRDIQKTQWTPALGRAAHRRHDREPAGLVPVAPAHLGRADRAVRAQADAGAASAHARADRRGRQARGEGRHRRLVRPRCARVAGRRSRRIREGHRRHGRLGRLGPVARVRAARRIPTTSSRRWISISKARTSIAAGSIPRC